jgi:protein arginine kinase activator
LHIYRPENKMLCQSCGKNNASVHVTQIVNGEKTEVYLCEACAREKGEIIDFPWEGKFPLHQFFSGFMGLVPHGGGGTAKKAASSGLQCSACGLTHAQFGQIGRFGCSRCYEAFGEALIPLFRRLHGNPKHMGKIPARAGADVKIKKEIERLRQELQKKIAEEAFEEAAQIRDEIRRLESGGRRLGGGSFEQR